MSKTPPAELSQAELDQELQHLDEAEKQETPRFVALWEEAEKRGML